VAVSNSTIRFNDGAAYERYMGQWSQLAEDVFLDWLVSAEPALIAALHDPAIDARIGSAEGLGDLGDTAAIPALTEALKDATQTRTHGSRSRCANQPRPLWRRFAPPLSSNEYELRCHASAEFCLELGTR